MVLVRHPSTPGYTPLDESYQASLEYFREKKSLIEAEIAGALEISGLSAERMRVTHCACRRA